MIPLSLDAGGSCVVGRGGRSAWVCERHTCVKTVADSPAPSSRAFRARVRPHQDLAAQAHAWYIDRQMRALRTAHRSGSLILNTGLPHGSFPEGAFWVRTKDHPSDAQEPHLILEKNNGSTLIICISSTEIEQVTGRPGCTLLGIRPGRLTQSLIDSLRRWHDLGYLAGLREEGPSTGHQPGLNKAVKESHVDQGPHRTTQSYPDDYPT